MNSTSGAHTGTSASSASTRPTGWGGGLAESGSTTQWRSDCVYIHELAPGSPMLNIVTGYSGQDSWVYEVDPTLPLELDPERGSHLISSRICRRARVIRCLQEPASVPESPSGHP
jgi:hypothetical protein